MRLDRYLATHDTIIRQFYNEGFIACDTLTIEPVGDHLWMSGEFGCLGELIVTVDKVLEYVDPPFV